MKRLGYCKNRLIGEIILSFLQYYAFVLGIYVENNSPILFCAAGSKWSFQSKVIAISFFTLKIKKICIKYVSNMYQKKK